MQDVSVRHCSPHTHTPGFGQPGPLTMFLGNQAIAVIKTKHDQTLDRFMRKPVDAIIFDRPPTGQHRTVVDIGMRQI